MNHMSHLLCRIEPYSIAIALEAVRSVVCAVEVFPQLDLPPSFLGAIDVHGSVVPVFDIRRRLGLSSREMELTDQFVVIDSTHGVFTIPVNSSRVVETAEPVSQRLLLEGQVVPMFDTEKLLAPAFS